MSERLVVVGQGYVGLPIAMRSVDAGFDVIGLEIDERRVGHLRGGQSYVEDINSEQLRSAIATGRYRASSSYADAAGFDVAVISVPTPLKDGLPDLSMIEAATRGLAPYVRRGSTLILESTTYPGTTDELVGPLVEEMTGLSPGTDFSLGYSPERIDPGNETWTLMNTPKVVSGVNHSSTDAVKRFYDRIVETTIVVSSCRVAELTKLLENTFRHVNVALMNELAVFSNGLGIDLWEAIDAAATKPFGYMRFTPGPGVGGHCLPVDPSYLSWRVKRTLGHRFRFIELANDVNDHMPDYVVHRATALLNEALKPVKGSLVLLLGLAYKKNTGDARQSPAIRVAELMVELGADVRAVDPHVESRFVPVGVRLVALTRGELDSADLVILLTDHDQILKQLPDSFDALALDTRNRLRRTSNVQVL